MDSLQGSVVRITYHNDSNNFSIIKLKSSTYTDIITITGYIWPVNVGSILMLQGEWKTDTKYGRQFAVVDWKETLPATISGIEKHLSSGLIKGVGTHHAKKIVSYFKEDTLRIIEENPDRLLEIEGIGIKRIESFKKSWQEHKAIKDLMLFLQDKGINTSFAAKIYKAYGENSIEIIKENPYKLADDIYGIGFKTADDIAFKLGIDKERYIRCRSSLLYVLSVLANEGHCYAEREELIQRAVEVLEIEEPKLVMTLDDMRHIGDVIAEKERTLIYLPALYHSEIDVSKRGKEIIATPRNKEINSINFPPDTIYDEAQQQSIKTAATSKFMVLTGGAGTGKTTTTKGIIEMFQKNKFEILLASPTGRTAKRMTEITGIEAKTIHRLLEYKPLEGYQKNEENKLSGDVLIVDESSMIDIVLMYNLLKAVPNHMTIILVSDKDQLPSIGAGNVFKDIIESGIVPVVKLEKIYR